MPAEATGLLLTTIEGAIAVRSAALHAALCRRDLRRQIRRPRHGRRRRCEFARDIVLLKQVGINPVVVHGGGPQIGAMLERLKIKSEFIDGLRVTDAATVEIVEMVLAGSINKQIVAPINQAGGKAVGLSRQGRQPDRGAQADAQPKRRSRSPTSRRSSTSASSASRSAINPPSSTRWRSRDIIPVIAPIGVGADGETYNINADTVAGAIAGALGADRLLLLTDVPGVLEDKAGDLIPTADARSRRAALIADGTISGGMIPKVETCLAAVAQGVGAAVILDGRVPHALLLEIFTEHGAGTLISSE